MQNNNIPQTSYNSSPNIPCPTDKFYPQQNWLPPSEYFNSSSIMQSHPMYNQMRMRQYHYMVMKNLHNPNYNQFINSLSSNSPPPVYHYPRNVDNSESATVRSNCFSNSNLQGKQINPLQLLYRSLVSNQNAEKPINFMYQAHLQHIEPNKNILQQMGNVSNVPMLEQLKQNDGCSSASLTMQQLLQNIEKSYQNNNTNKSQNYEQNLTSSKQQKTKIKIKNNRNKNVEAQINQQAHQNPIYSKISKTDKDRSSKTVQSSISNSKSKIQNNIINKQKQQEQYEQDRKQMETQKYQNYRFKKIQTQEEESIESIPIIQSAYPQPEQGSNNAQKKMRKKILSDSSSTPRNSRKQMGTQADIQTPQISKKYYSLYKAAQLLKQTKFLSKDIDSILQQKSQSPLQLRIQQFFDMHPELLQPQIFIRMEQSVMDSVCSLPKESMLKKNNNTQKKPIAKNQKNLEIIKPNMGRSKNMQTNSKRSSQNYEQLIKVVQPEQNSESYDQSQVLQSFKEDIFNYRYLQEYNQKETSDNNAINSKFSKLGLPKNDTNIKKSKKLADERTKNYQQKQKETKQQKINNQSQIHTKKLQQLITVQKITNIISSFSELKQIVMFEFAQYKIYINKWLKQLTETYERQLMQKQQAIFVLQIEKISLEDQLRQIKTNIIKRVNQNNLDKQKTNPLLTKNMMRNRCSQHILLRKSNFNKNQQAYKESTTWKQLYQLEEIITIQIKKIQLQRNIQNPSQIKYTQIQK